MIFINSKVQYKDQVVEFRIKVYVDQGVPFITKLNVTFLTGQVKSFAPTV